MFRLLGKLLDLRTSCYLLVILQAVLPGWGKAEQANPLSVVVDYVIDGDSLVVKRNGKTMEVRLWGIDAPEYDQPDNAQSKDGLKRLTAGQKGTLYVKYRDRYDRYVAVLVIDQFNINQELVKDGHAWVYRRYCNETVCERWIQMEGEAKANRHGLWDGRDPIPPWRWKAKR